jgi:erythromycin esterase-like protein
MPAPAADPDARSGGRRACRTAAGLAAALILSAVTPSTAAAPPLDAAVAAARQARFVLLGEATHGTHEFYVERARITQHLVEDARPGAIVLEADGTEVERANRYVRGLGTDRSAAEALADFRRFPRWMWRNHAFAQFVEALRARNLQRPEATRIGLYGMDVYDLYGALDRVRGYARRHLPMAVAAADAAARCFAPHRRSTEAYGVASRKPGRSCAAPAQALLDAVEQSPVPSGADPAEERFAALQAAAAVVSGEAYFHAAFAGAYSWNVRERAMAAAVRRVAGHAGATAEAAPRIVVWTHNSHIATAAATAMVERGELSLADLLRQNAPPGKVFTLGFLTHAGSFMGAPAWDRPGQVYRLAPAAANSVEGLLRRYGTGPRLLMLRDAALAPALSEWRSERGIGVVFDARSPGSVYSHARLAAQFDAVAFLPETSAVTPLP